jgi:hypothetical protein
MLSLVSLTIIIRTPRAPGSQPELNLEVLKLTLRFPPAEALTVPVALVTYCLLWQRGVNNSEFLVRRPQLKLIALQTPRFRSDEVPFASEQGDETR